MYISSVSLSMLSTDRELFHQIIHLDKNQQTIQEFATDQKNKILVVSKFEEKEQQKETISFSLEISTEHINSQCIAFIKRQVFQLSHGVQVNQFSSLLQIINLGYYGIDSNPIKINHIYVQNCFLPIFNAYKSEFDNKTIQEKESYYSIIRKLNDLNISLLQCQQSVDVPEIVLVFDNRIKERVNKCKAENRVATTDDFVDLLDNENFIESLSSLVIKWTKDIAMMTKQKLDMTQATVLQEKMYWNSLLRSLNMVDQQLKKPEVDVTLKILSLKKKVGITTAFYCDLNFKRKLEECTVCNNFTSEIPISDLLFANNMNDVQQAIDKIFKQFKRINQFLDYTVERLYLLVEALSKDLNQQMIKILSEYKLMEMPYGKYLELQKQIEGVFGKWNSEFWHFCVVIHKPTGNNPMNNMVKTESYFEHYKAIKKRIDQISEIRKFHEQLKNVIEDIVAKEKKSNKAFDQQIFSTNEVVEAYNIFLQLNVLDVSQQGDEQLQQVRPPASPRGAARRLLTR